MFCNVNINKKLTLNTFQQDTSIEKCQAFLLLHLPHETKSQLVLLLMHLLPFEPYGLLLRALRPKKLLSDEKALEQRPQSRSFFNNRSTNTKNALQSDRLIFEKGVYYTNELKKGVK